MSLQAAIKKRFSGFSLDVSLNTDGGVMGILGASGSGKSMTLKCCLLYTSDAADDR